MCQLNHKCITYLSDKDNDDDAGKIDPNLLCEPEEEEKSLKKLNKSFSRSRHRHFIYEASCSSSCPHLESSI